MLIPLDYYRILGLPIQATAEQLQQAHRDRALQLPRREYSEVAITSRKSLLDEAYAVLSNPEQRQSYDANFLAKTLLQTKGEGDDPENGQHKASEPTKEEALTLSESDINTTGIEITEGQFIGGLLILQELGEYELLLRQSFPYLAKNGAAIKEGPFGDPQLVLPDIVLTVALACLELGREQWQQGQYENAAESLETGQDLLLRHNLFVSLRGEIQSDLYKLRPYRILELVALPEDQVHQRRKGLQLLNNMLQERGGIDGQGEDRSGLNMEDFLRFIQQLRTHLTTSEQQTLFESESRRPSAVATYLTVYTLIATGFSQRQPTLIRRAKLMLLQLGRRQDVNLEKSICALLLGQTEEASRALELSQEQDPLVFIKENSQDSPDLLPGLCFYTESWLSEEVFPHFRDLVNHSPSLKEYFADEQVQVYLEASPSDNEPSNEWVMTRSRGPAVAGMEQQVSPLGTTVPGTTALLTSSVSEGELPSNGTTATVSNIGIAEKQLNHTKELESTDKNNPYAHSRKRKGGRSRSSNHAENTGELMPKIHLALIALGILLGLWILWWLLSGIGKLIFDRGPKLQGEHALIFLDQPPVEIPAPAPTPVTAPQVLDNNNAQKILESWLIAKASALGQGYDLSQLQVILVDPALSRWRQTAETLKKEGGYRTYQHKVTVGQVQPKGTSKDQAIVEAEVQETTSFFDRGKLLETKEDQLKIRYDLIQKNGQWRLRDWEVVR